MIFCRRDAVGSDEIVPRPENEVQNENEGCCEAKRRETRESDDAYAREIQETARRFQSGSHPFRSENRGEGGEKEGRRGRRRGGGKEVWSYGSGCGGLGGHFLVGSIFLMKNN